jgi:hypothetical protein
VLRAAAPAALAPAVRPWGADPARRGGRQPGNGNRPASSAESDERGYVIPSWHDNSMMYPEPGSKRHAVRKDDPDSPLYWVGNDADWREVRREPRVPLECPERCGVELISVENRSYQYTPRFFRIKPPRPPCDHWEPLPGHGGPEGAQHNWLKNEIAEIVRDLGYGAIVEHWPTRADVYVESSPLFCLEIQLRSTTFAARTQVRESRGARACWLIRDGLNAPSANEALARAQAVRFRVVDNSRRVTQPWRDPPESVLADRSHIEVFSAIVTRPRDNDRLKPGEPWFRTGGYMDAWQFLDEILSGRRRPYDGRELGLRQAAWALDADVADYRAFSEEMAARRASRPVPRQVQAPAPRPIPPVERADGCGRAGPRTDDRERARIREQAAADLARHIDQIEARIEELEEHRAKVAADAEGLGSTATGNRTLGADLELRALASRLAILRRQLAVLTERPAAASPPSPFPPPVPVPVLLPAPAVPSLPVRRTWWQPLVWYRNKRG